MPATAPLTADEALQLLVSAVREAGEIGLRFARDGARTYEKADASPVTEADLAIDAHLAARLKDVTSAAAWLSEEAVDDPVRLTKRQVWIVDPIDGTRGFVAGNGEWVISAALVADGRPIAGVLLRPTTGDLYTATEGRGAHLNGVRLAIAPGPVEAIVGAAGPKSFTDLLRAHAPALEARWRLSSLALRLAYLAENRFDVAIAKTNAHDWDLAAADLIVQEAGGRVSGFDGMSLTYNRPDPVHPALVAAGRSRHDHLARLLREAGI